MDPTKIIFHVILIQLLVALATYYSFIFNQSTSSSQPNISNNVVTASPLPKQMYSVRTLTTGAGFDRTRDIEITEIADAALDHPLLPSFADSGFEFKNMATIPGVSLEHYHQFLAAIPSVTLNVKKDEYRDQKRINYQFSPVQVSRLPAEHLSTLNAIFQDFLHRNHFISGDIIWPRVTAYIYTKRFETHIHLDGPDPARDVEPWPIRWKEFKLWIPMHEMNNLVLSVGDASKMNDVDCVDPWNRITETERHQDCVENQDFENIKWYHQPKMRTQDVIWLAAKDIPHCAIDRYRETYHLYYRSALLIYFRPYAVNVRAADE